MCCNVGRAEHGESIAVYNISSIRHCINVSQHIHINFHLLKHKKV